MKEIIGNRLIKAASLKRITNSIKVLSSLAISIISKKSNVWGVPIVVTVEPTVLCNLRCPQCVTGMGRIKREQHYFDLNLFKQVIEQIGDKLWYLLLYNQGEPFLNPNLVDFIKIAKQKRIYVTTSTNGHFLTDKDFIRTLVKSGLDTIIISLDGADSATYLTYREGGNFERVIDGIKQLIQLRNQLSCSTPKVIVQCLVTRYNEMQREQFIKLTNELNVDRLLFKTFQIESQETGLQFLPKNSNLRRYAIDNEQIANKKSIQKICPRLWYSTVILSDGSIVPCCFDKKGKYSFGNIAKVGSINQVWKSDAYNKFRERILQRRGSFGICKNCTQNETIYL